MMSSLNKLRIKNISVPNSTKTAEKSTNNGKNRKRRTRKKRKTVDAIYKKIMNN